MNIDTIKYDANGLVPAIIQDEVTGTVLMLAYMNAEALSKTLESGVTWFYSRSRRALWQKGETSGHVQTVKEMYYDCDADTILVKVSQTGAACHEGTFSCFSRRLDADTEQAAKLFDPDKVYKEPLAGVLYELYNVINDRKHNPKEGSYTNYLFEKGQDKILKKVGEEAAETIIASKNNDKAEILYEMADLWYHCLVLLANHNITPSELFEELKKRRK
ncbi:bifunctional phosphoribosyl-AMP cyclohydrolase/phosphoribosyl-ATP diphosphatase HisIE [Sporomusa sp. KB1]|jgi:phosphoribosyl-ATP pyrophosphohydrolase/phosphoribosyl-AMP cyclohydrolase|uniref:bifunctional phosphoribosyl-AMP cyclohydrolase/phosphoribosyl-ATP diphosphatase HisIE n=1 Tax=Sporomusa sp. KB1 TaxID=943346 RepID=UPI0011AC4D3A|nr:bifunctional phosphoribosyl-AMP cyclohydrolase/phosphoribosyl-ATP diphosphatase HisIE [Sporomusa sp. KB1]TWH52098.1 phosphoribosyl-ATP pyrophosphatase /phosphoribosyl-AMP cyclohydrolase [Sporomusa sp. KB1]